MRLSGAPVSQTDIIRMDDTMNPSAGRPASWLMADGAASISASMLVAVLINVIQSLAGLWGLGFLHGLTNKEDGVIIVATLLLLPTSFVVYGVSQVIFAAKEAVEKRAMAKGRKAERERIEQILKQHGVELPPEVARIIAGTSESSPRS